MSTPIRRVVMPGRILERHVGGNTTYARYVAAGLRERSVDVACMRYAAAPAATMLWESAEGLRSYSKGSVLHYVADTGPLLRTRTPSVVTVHGVASRWISTARTPRQEATWRARVQRAIRSTDAVVTVSESSADDISHVFNIDRSAIRVIPHGVGVPAPENSEMSRELRELLPSEYLLYLGNIEPRKNLVELLKAMELPELKALGIPLVIAGKPAWNAGESLDAIARSSAAIHVGFVSDSDRYHLMRGCTALVFPSLYEGFGFPVVEALKIGTTVITTDRGSLAEVAGPAFRLSGVTSDAIAAGVTAALGDSETIESARRAGIEWAGRFTWESSVNAHLAVYQAVIENR